MEDTQGESLADFILHDPSMIKATQELRDAEPDTHAKLKMKKARYYQRHKREVLARNKKWRDEHKEYVGLCERVYGHREATKQRRRERRRERMATDEAYREKTKAYMREWGKARRERLAADPEKLEALRESNRRSARASYERQVKRMAADPEYAAKVRAERHQRYLKRRARILADPEKLEADRARLRRNRRRYVERKKEVGRND